MSVPIPSSVVSHNSEMTEQLAKVLGANCRGGEVIELVSDLGGGKTTFVRGMARGLGSKDHVSSPTFKVSNVYQGATLTLYHYDFYRLPEAGHMTHELQEVMEDPKAIIVVEWGKIVRHVLPEKRCTIHIKNKGEDDRELSFSYPDELKYLVEGVC